MAQHVPCLGRDEKEAAQSPKPTSQHAAVGQGTGQDLEQPPTAALGTASAIHEAADPGMHPSRRGAH